MKKQKIDESTKYACHPVSPNDHVLTEPQMKGVVGHVFSDKGFLTVIGSNDAGAKTVYHLQPPWTEVTEEDGVTRNRPMSFDKFEELKAKKLAGEEVEEDLLQQITIHLSEKQNRDLTDAFAALAKRVGGYLNEKGVFNKRFPEEALPSIMKGGPSIDSKGEPIIKAWVDPDGFPNAPKIKVVTHTNEDGSYKWKSACVKDLHTADASKGGNGKGYLQNAEGVYFLEDMSGVWYTRAAFGIKFRLSMALIKPNKGGGGGGGVVSQTRAFNRSVDAFKLAGIVGSEESDDDDDVPINKVM